MEHSLRDSDRQLLYIKALTLFALTKYKLANAITTDISSTIRKLIELCTTYKTTMVMFECGADMQSLLRAYIKKNPTDSTASTILDEMATLPIIAQHSLSNNFSLSERELAILALLDSQLSVSDIAEREFVTVNTVKTHIKNIYSKMDVHSRKHAVEIGKQNHLI
jgi:LuxR family maltose regulon positive regulatory protein